MFDFSGLNGAVTSTFGEPVLFEPAIGTPATINAIWAEEPIEVDTGVVSTDEIRCRLHVRAGSVLPREGDHVTRIRTGKQMKIATPIQPDGEGMIVCEMVI